jgi:hypothetical protein
MNHRLTNTVSSIPSVACLASTGEVSRDICTYSLWVTGICHTFVDICTKNISVSETTCSLMMNFRNWNINFVEFLFKKYAKYCLLILSRRDNAIDLNIWHRWHYYRYTLQNEVCAYLPPYFAVEILDILLRSKCNHPYLTGWSRKFNLRLGG